MLDTIQNAILFFIWPLLAIFSVIIFAKGLSVYSLVKNSLVGKVTKALVYTILVDISSLGMVSVMYIFSRPKNTGIVLTVFILWFIVFVWSLKTLSSASKEIKKMVGQK